MMYKVNELAELSGVSPRTLRYYDQIGLLTPERSDANGYRLYGREQVDRLQQILFFRELGMALEDIGRVLTASGFDRSRALRQHLAALEEKKERIEALIRNVSNTIRAEREGITMTDKEKFEGFKQKAIDENEAKYGTELRKRYGDDAIDKSVEKAKAMTMEQWNSAEELSKAIDAALGEAFATGDPTCQAAQRACDLHRQWLCMYWKDGTYSKEAHAALAEGYVADPRFTAYYDRIAKGCTEFFRDAMLVYCGK